MLRLARPFSSIFLRRTLCTSSEEALGAVTARDLNPEEVVRELDRHIIGQDDAKKAVAIALRNRWRRQQLPEDLQREVSPTNILLVGPTGSGKTEISRRVAKLANAPFAKTEATRFTEVGIVGSDTTEMIEDLVENAVQMEMEAARARCADAAKSRATRAIVDALVLEGMTASRQSLTNQVESGELDSRVIRIRFPRKSPAIGGAMMAGGGRGAKIDARSLSDLLGALTDMHSDEQPQSVTVEKARHRLIEDAYRRLIDEDLIQKRARKLAEQSGIVFIDEIDKVAHSTEHASGVLHHKGEGVQKELLSLLEGTRVNTKHGPIDTKHILFVSAGAFHRSKPSDLLPELQGRLPIRVTLAPLKQKDLVRILQEPDYNLIRQTQAMLATENVHLNFTSDGINEIANMAAHMNETVDNIGARRLRTVLAKVTEDISFQAHNRGGEEVIIDADYVKKALAQFVQSRDLSRYVL